MTNKHVKMYSTSYIIKEFRMKTTLKYFYTLMRMAKIKKEKYLTIPDADKYVEKQEVALQNSIATLENSLTVSYEATHGLTI